MTTNRIPTITLTNAHGAFTVDPDRLGLVITRTAAWSDALLLARTCGLAGFSDGDIEVPSDSDALRDCTRLELQVILLESGNFL